LNWYSDRRQGTKSLPQIRDLVNIGPEVGVSASLELDLSGEVNFTMGAKASVRTLSRYDVDHM